MLNGDKIDAAKNFCSEEGSKVVTVMTRHAGNCEQQFTVLVLVFH